MRVGSLFAGVGGLELGLERAGMEIVWQAEADKQARSVLKKHWPNVHQFEDVKDVRLNQGRHPTQQDSLHKCGGTDFSSGTGSRSGGSDDPAGRVSNQCGPELESITVLAGGFPCQDYSAAAAGKRRGLAGDRGALWWEFHRIASEQRPTWIVGENVPGLLSSNGGRDFRTIINSLVQLGYGVTWAVLDSQWFGVPQRRRRLFIVGHSGGVPRPEILAISEGLYGHPAPSREARQSSTQTTGNGVAGGGVSWYERHDQDGRVTDLTGKATQTLSANADNGCDLPLVFDTTQVTSPENGSNPQPGDPCHPLQSSAHVPLLTSTPSTFHSIAPTLNSSGAGTSRCGGQGAEPQFYVGPRPRRLTPKECERLQGFPDDWTRYYHDGTEVADSPRYRMMGNAVTVNVSEWIGRRIMEAR